MKGFEPPEQNPTHGHTLPSLFARKYATRTLMKNATGPGPSHAGASGRVSFLLNVWVVTKLSPDASFEMTPLHESRVQEVTDHKVQSISAI